MSVVTFPQSDRLYRLMRQQQFADHDARLRPTQDELRARRHSANAPLSREAAKVTRQPRAFNPNDEPPFAA